MGSGVDACGIAVVAMENGVIPIQLLIHPCVNAGAAEESAGARPAAGDALIPRLVSAVAGDDRCSHLGSPSSG
jgi:hypothetical protein